MSTDSRRRELGKLSVLPSRDTLAAVTEPFGNGPSNRRRWPPSLDMRQIASSLAETVESQSTTPAGPVVSPMRFAEAQLTKAAVEA